MKIRGFATLIRALDLWAERWRKREVAGDMIIVRCADGVIFGFEHEADARCFLEVPADGTE